MLIDAFYLIYLLILCLNVHFIDIFVGDSVIRSSLNEYMLVIQCAELDF